MRAQFGRFRTSRISDPGALPPGGSKRSPIEAGRPSKGHMASWLEGLSIRTRIILLTLAILCPVAAILVWHLVSDVGEARDAAHDKVRILATATAADLQRLLAQAETILARLATRPMVKELDPTRCDPLIADYVRLNPEYNAFGVRDVHGNVICAYLANPVPQLSAERYPWFAEALRAGRFRASDVMVGPRTGRRAIALTYPIRDDAGSMIGLLILQIDLLTLSQQLLATTPANAVVTVTDPSQAVLIRSVEADTYIGTRPAAGEPDPARGARDGTLAANGRDGVARLFAFLTVPGVEWRVSASLPQAEVFAPYRATLIRTVGIGAALIALALGLAWRLSAAIVKPIAELEGAAARVAAGDDAVRAAIHGPPELRSVARQFNRTLDARALSEARLRGIFESAVDAIITADEHQIIVQANPAAATMLRCSLNELIGSPLRRFVPERFREQHERDVRDFGADAVGARHMGPQRDVMAQSADGEEFPIEASISHLSVEGRPLYTVILRDITARRHAEYEQRAGNARLAASRAELRRLVAALDSAQESERGRIARELHDDLQQTLAAIRMDAAAARDKLAPDPAAASALLAGVDALASAAIVSTRRIVNDLQPRMLEDLGLVAALEALVRQFSQRSGIACQLEARDDLNHAALDSASTQAALYRVVQEALNNVLKHARASAVQIRLEGTADGDLALRVSDNGQGMQSCDRDKPQSFGLLGMQERVRALGGVLHIDSEPGAGTVIEVRVPVAAPRQ